MFGFDEKERQKEPKGTPKNPDKINTKLTFDAGNDELVLNYDYKVNISALRIKNVIAYEFYINDVQHNINEVLMINPGDKLTIWVDKDNSAAPATLTLQEKLIY